VIDKRAADRFPSGAVFARFYLIAAAVVMALAVGQLSAARMPWGVGPHGEALSLEQVWNSILAMPYHHLSAELRQRQTPAVGLFEIRINPETGRAKEVRVLVSTHDAVMDRECAQICVNWQFRPGVIAVARVHMGWERTIPRSSASKWVF
jgi:hypothetical protein